MKKRIALILALMLCMSSLGGCNAEESAVAPVASVPQEAVSLEELKQTTAELSMNTYYVDSDKAIVDYAIAEMKKIFPNVTVIPENRTDADGTVLKTRAAVGELPDIFECPASALESFVTSGDILALDDAMAEMDFASYVYDGVLENRAGKDGKIYAISALPNEPLGIFYNKKVFADCGLSEPKNFEEFKNVVKTLKEKGVIPMSIFAQEKWPGLQMYDLAVVAEEATGISGLENGTVKITDPQFVSASKKLEELISLGLIGKGAFNTNASQAFEQFTLGQAGMLVNGVWYFGDAKEYGDNIGYFSYNPFADAGKEEIARYNLSGGMMSPGGYAVNAKGKNVALSTQYMLHFNIERAKAKTVLNGAVCALREDVQPKEARYESYQQFAESVGNVKSYTKYSWGIENAEVKTALEDSVEMLLAGNYTADNFIKDLDAQISASLQPQ